MRLKDLLKVAQKDTFVLISSKDGEFEYFEGKVQNFHEEQLKGCAVFKIFTDMGTLYIYLED